MAEYKLLDPHRKAVLRLPHLAFKLWMTFWMNESDDREAYIDLDTIEEQSGMDRKSAIKWRNYLVSTGWLIKLQGSAAERYSKPTRGSHDVCIYRVNDPTKEKVFPNLENFHPFSKTVEKFSSGKFPPKVYASVSGSGLPGSFSEYMIPDVISTVTDLKDGSLPSEEKNRENQKPKNRSVPCEAQAASPLPPQAAVKPKFQKSPHKYDAPFPPDFDSDKSAAGVKYRNEWMARHRLPAEKLKELAASVPPPENAPTPSALWLAQELFRTVKQFPCVDLSIAAPKWESRWVADFERLLKTYSMEELTDIIKVSQIRADKHGLGAAFNSQEIVDEIAELHARAKERRAKDSRWNQVEERYKERYGGRRE